MVLRIVSIPKIRIVSIVMNMIILISVTKKVFGDG